MSFVDEMSFKEMITAMREVSSKKFDEDIVKFIKNKCVRILYHDEQKALINYGNQYYVFFPFEFCDYGLKLTKDNLLEAIENYSAIMHAFGELAPDELIDLTVVMSDQTLKHAVATKDYTDKHGPSEYIDLKLEKYILKKYKHKKCIYTWPED